MNLLLAGALAVLLFATFSSGEGVEESNKARYVNITSSLKIDQGQLLGPESIEFDELGFIYVSVGDGSIRKVNPITFEQTVYAYSVKLANRTNCGQAGNATQEAICGRPLGIKFDRHYNLYVADAYYGLLFVPRRDPSDVRVLANSSDGVPFGFTNSLVINKAQDTIYLTDTSPTDRRSDFLKVFLEAKPQGRLVRYNIRTGKTTTLLSDLVFGNGVAFNKDECEVIINETSLKRIRRYYLSGPKAGQNDFFNSDIGGYPDNVEYDPLTGLFLVGCSGIADPAADAIIAGKQPQTAPLPPNGYIAVLDCEGTLKRALVDSTGQYVVSTSEAQRRGGYIYVGSVQVPWLTRISAFLLIEPAK